MRRGVIEGETTEERGHRGQRGVRKEERRAGQRGVIEGGARERAVIEG